MHSDGATQVFPKKKKKKKIKILLQILFFLILAPQNIFFFNLAPQLGGAGSAPDHACHEKNNIFAEAYISS
jgi:flagellar basal body-associated protein FliL